MNINYRLLRLKYVLLVAMLILAGSVYPQSRKRLYIGNDDHTDYMWAGNEAQYDTAFVTMLDYQLRKIDSTKNNPDDFQVRFNCDGSYWLQAYAKYRSAAQFEKLVAAIRSGHISSPVTMLVNTYGAQPTEAVLRGMYYAGQLERKYHLKFTLANAMENNTLPLGLSALWAGAGAKYSWKGIGGYGSQLSYAKRADRKYQLYRSVGLDSSGVIMKWYNYNEKKTGPIGGYGECRLTLKKTDIDRDMDRVIKYLDDFSSSPIYPYQVAASFGYGHDDLASYVAQQFVTAAEKGTNPNRSVRVSNEEDFFKDIELNYPNLPVQAVSFGNEWDILSASMNETTAKVRRSTEKLRSAEALAAVVSLHDKSFGETLKDKKNAAWTAFGMYWEHNWTGDGPVKQSARAAWQIKLQKQISAYTDTLQTLAAEKLGEQIKRGRFPRFYIFNQLGWDRSGVADVLYQSARSVKIIDVATGGEVPVQFIQKGGQEYLRIKVENIPSVGYKVFEIRPGSSSDQKTDLSSKDGWLDNTFYRVKISRSGAITQIYDKKARRQVVSEQDGRYLNDLGYADINAGKELEVENAGPISITYKASSNLPVPHTTRVTLYANSPVIDIQNSIDANFKDVKTWAFSLNLNNVTTHHEELGAILTVKKVSHGGNYSDQNARYDWQTFNHFADISENNYGVTIANQDCSFFKLGKSTVDSLNESSSQLNALAGGQVDHKVEDNGALGIYNQNGETSFHYAFALQVHQFAFNAVDAMKFAMEDQNQLVTGWITGEKAIQNGTSFSLLHINAPAVLLWSVKPQDESAKNGLIARFWNFNTHTVTPQIILSKPLTGAWQTTHIETDIAPLKYFHNELPVKIKANQISTYRILE